MTPHLAVYDVAIHHPIAGDKTSVTRTRVLASGTRPAHDIAIDHYRELFEVPESVHLYAWVKPNRGGAEALLPRVAVSV